MFENFSYTLVKGMRLQKMPEGIAGFANLPECMAIALAGNDKYVSLP